MSYAAHIKADKIQTVIEHCKNVSVLAKEYASEINMEHVGEIQGLLHDIGKETEKFDRYIRNETNLRRGDIDHCYAGAKYLLEACDSKSDEAITKILELIARTILSHHGLHDWIDTEGEDYLKRRVNKNDDYSEILGNIKQDLDIRALRETIRQAQEEYCLVKEKIEALSIDETSKGFYFGFLERMLQSILVDADRTDTSIFMRGEANIEADAFDQKEVWEKAMRCLNEKLESFQRQKPGTEKEKIISTQRKSISDRCFEFANSHNVGICRLIVPTGGGKTLTSLRAALQIAIRQNKKRIFYIGPFLSLLEQNAGIIRSIVGAENFLEHHSDILSRIDEKEELQQYELRADKWDDPVIATTLVQFLNTLFDGAMSSVRRLHQLANSVIIIDEVQAIPLKCTYLVNLAINFLHKICNASVILCSATQPPFEELGYPLILDEEESMSGDYSKDFEIFRRAQVVPQLKLGGYTYEEAAEFCVEKAKESQNLLVVVNTKAAAAEIYHYLEEYAWSTETELFHLSTSMCSQHRKEIIGQIRALVDPKNPCKKRCICVTTQLIEAGVDVSFQCVVRSLAGIDHVAQVAGRCNRSGEYDNDCIVYLIDIVDEKLNHLKEIQDGQMFARKMIQNKRYEDYLAVKTMTDYYRAYYKNNKNQFGYPAKDMGYDTTLLRLLSTNDYRRGLTGSVNKFGGQAFRTAGDQFEVIGKNTETILVPYNQEAKELILELNQNQEDEIYRMLLRKAQKYTVDVFPYMRKALEKNGALFQLISGVITLREEYYDQKIGIKLEGDTMNMLLY